MKKSIFILFFFCSYLAAEMNDRGFEAFPNYYFVESGTFKGAGINFALRAKFPSIHSIEISHAYAQAARDFFKDNANVVIYEGDSGKILYNIIKDLDKPVTFWLDGHRETPSQDGTKNTPLLQELEQIKRHPIKNHTILIDDLQCCGQILFDFITFQQIVKKILEINSCYSFRFMDGGSCGRQKYAILVAEVKS